MSAINLKAIVSVCRLNNAYETRRKRWLVPKYFRNLQGIFLEMIPENTNKVIAQIALREYQLQNIAKETVYCKQCKLSEISGPGHFGMPWYHL